MAISYVVDIYRRQLEPAKPLDFAVYISFFPHLLAGPIVRGTELLPQIRRRRDPNSVDYSRAFWLILAGLFKKVVISSYVSSAIVTPVFTSPTQHSAPEAIFAAWGYAVQIYCDFSGYTDIAIGLAMLLGFRFPQNFDAPYTARNLQDFWRRWHMTLSRWLRDYLYIPLGGSANGQAQTLRNIMITMVLGGLWHGAAWTFVIWGALQGIGQSFGHVRRTSRERRGLPAVADGPVRVWVQRFLTFQFVCLGWVFFNATGTSQAFSVIGRVFSGWGEASPLVTPLLVITVSARWLRSSCPRCASTGCRRRSRARGQRCRSACSASPCSASPPSVPSASRPSSTTASDVRAHTPAPRRLGDPRGVPVAPARRARRPRRTGACVCRGRACWRLAVAAFALWFLLYAPTLQHNAQVSPVGHEAHGQPRCDRPGRRHQPRPAALALRLHHGAQQRPVRREVRAHGGRARTPGGQPAKPVPAPKTGGTAPTPMTPRRCRPTRRTPPRPTRYGS